MRKGSDWLRQQPGNRKQGSGISALDLVKLAPNQRKIMRVLLRKAEMTYSDLCKVVEAMPEADRMDRSELDKTLEVLVQEGWLIQVGDQHTTYKVKLRRKAGSSLQRSIWDALDSNSKKSKTPDESGTEDSEE